MDVLIPPVRPRYNIKADHVDFRDFKYEAVGGVLRQLVDLRRWASPVEDQLHLGSCTGNAVVGVYELLVNLNTPTKFTDLSRLFVYYNARLLEGVADEDVGAYVRDGIKAVKHYGVCMERVWPYDITRYKVEPSALSYQEAKSRNIKNYYRLSTVNDILDAVNNNRPVVFGMLVYAAFDNITGEPGILNMPKSTESPIGGHAMCVVGYDIPRKLLLVRNSFGINWGDNGYCWIPFKYAEDSFVDMWTFDVDLIAT